jgi:hypothetical protein
VSDAPAVAPIGNRGYPVLVLLPWLLGILAYWIIVVVDPYHLRHEGPAFRLANHRYPDLEWPRLIGLATAQSHDVVLLGGSTALPISPDIMREAIPRARSPINLSYIAPRPRDMPQILPRIAQITGLERVILFMDFTLMERGPRRSASGEILQNMATTNWSHGGDFALSTALASLHATMSGTYDLPVWSRLTVPDFMVGATPVTQSAGVMQRFRDAVQRHADDVFAKSTLTCRQIPYVQTVLVPFLTEMAKKHVAVDLVFPSIPYVLYYDWIEHAPPFNTLLQGPVFDQFIVFKKCVIAARDHVGVDSNRVIALDTNDSVSGDLHRYFDNIHLIDPEAYRTVMRMIADGDETITSANIDRHEAALRNKVAREAALIVAR